MNSITSFQTYIPFVLRTLKDLPDDKQRIHAVAGMAGEWGEVIDNLKKHVVYGKPLDKVNLAEELGDIAYYLAVYLNLKGLNGKTVDETVDEFVQTLSLNSTTPYQWLEAAVTGCAWASSLIEADEKKRGVTDEEIVLLTAILLLMLLFVADTTLVEALNRNIEKLAKRYGEKYSDFNALNRDTQAERAILGRGISSV